MQELFARITPRGLSLSDKDTALTPYFFRGGYTQWAILTTQNAAEFNGSLSPETFLFYLVEVGEFRSVSYRSNEKKFCPTLQSNYTMVSTDVYDIFRKIGQTETLPDFFHHLRTKCIAFSHSHLQHSI